MTEYKPNILQLAALIEQSPNPQLALAMLLEAAPREARDRTPAINGSECEVRA